MLSRYFSEISCRSAITFSGINPSAGCSARSTMTRSAYRPLVEISMSRSSLTFNSYYIAGKWVNQQKNFPFGIDKRAAAFYNPYKPTIKVGIEMSFHMPL